MQCIHQNLSCPLIHWQMVLSHAQAFDLVVNQEVDCQIKGAVGQVMGKAMHFAVCLRLGKLTNYIVGWVVSQKAGKVTGPVAYQVVSHESGGEVNCHSAVS
jgi:hypothetical protein